MIYHFHKMRSLEWTPKDLLYLCAPFQPKVDCVQQLKPSDMSHSH